MLRSAAGAVDEIGRAGSSPESVWEKGVRVRELGLEDGEGEWVGGEGGGRREMEWETWLRTTKRARTGQLSDAWRWAGDTTRSYVRVKLLLGDVGEGRVVHGLDEGDRAHLERDGSTISTDATHV